MDKPKTYQAAMARIREQDANFAGMLRQKLEQEKRAQLAERECEQYRETLVDNEAYCEAMMAVRDDAIARAEQAEAALATVLAAVPVGAFRGIDTMIRKNLDHTPWEWATIVKWLATLPQPEVPRDEDSANAPAQEWQKAALQKLLREVQP